MARIGLAIVVAIGLLAGVFVVGIKLIPEDALRARFIEEAERLVGRSLLVGGATRLELLPEPRLLVDEVALTEGPPRLSVERTTVALTPWSWLRGGRMVQSVHLQGLRISGEAADGPQLLGLLARFRAPDRLTLADGRLVLREQGQRRLTAVDGEFRFERQTDGTGQLDGTVSVNGLPVALSATMEPNGDVAWPPFQATARFDQVDLDRLWHELAVPIVLSGTLSGEVSLSLPPTDGAALPWEALAGSGDLVLANARFAVPGGERRAAAFDQVEARLVLAAGVVTLDPVAAEAGALRLAGDGRLDLVERQVRLALDPITGPGGGLQVEGPLAAPRLAVEPPQALPAGGRGATDLSE